MLHTACCALTAASAISPAAASHCCCVMHQQMRGADATRDSDSRLGRDVRLAPGGCCCGWDACLPELVCCCCGWDACLLELVCSCLAACQLEGGRKLAPPLRHRPGASCLPRACRCVRSWSGPGGC